MPNWSFVGQKTFAPDDLNEVIGSFSLGENEDTLWIRITQLDTGSTSPWAYGILSWRTSEGYELGSVKAYGTTQSEVFRLGVGLSPSVRDGNVIFTPRGFNLGWIRNGWPWPLKFEAVSGKSGSGGGSTVAAVTNSFVDSSDNGLPLVRVDFS